ncbi:MAG: HAMP domain-containing histidine kinase [candidate division Zixibacteria bacterium]|nr:HAMP domain-containing histidine kinase [candidate division Zixibacteria bacterium]
MLTIKVKIILACTVVFGLTLAVFAWLVYAGSKQAELAKLDARLESHSDKLESEIEEQYDKGQFPKFADLKDISTEGLPTAMVQIWDSAGHIILGDTVLARLSGSVWQSRRLNDTTIEVLRGLHKTYRCRWCPVEIHQGAPAVLEVAAPLTAVHASLAHLRTLFMITIPAALLIIAVSGYLITRAAFRPLSGMAQAAQGISASSLHQRLELPKTSDEVRLLAETLNRMIERIEAAFRSQRQFVADASHEIRTPLTIINSELEYAQKATSPTDVQESIRVSLSEIDRLSRLTEGLLLLAKLDVAQPTVHRRPVRLDELVVDTVQLMRRLAQARHIKLDLYVQDAYEIAADHDMVKRAALNVLENAIKYSPRDATVSVRLHAIAGTSGLVRLEIEDHGPGIAPADQSRVFERFYRTPTARADSNGSGLGLAIAKRLVELNGGRILLSSEPARGTKMTIELPSEGIC